MKFIDEKKIENKKVILRCDFNVPIENGKVLDDTKVVKSLKTINYLLDNNCSLILLSHLGRVKSKKDKIEKSLLPVKDVLSKLLNMEIKFVSSPVGMDVINVCKELKPKEIVLLENTRFCDYPEKLESHNDLNLAKYWSVLGDVFVVDAFASLHRVHASVAGISNYLPTYYGFLVKEEISNLNPLINNIQRPYTVFMGGAKVDDKLQYIKGLLEKCDYLLVGGGIANSFLYACGFDVMESLCTSDEITLLEIKNLMKEYRDKIVLPIDFVIEEDKILDLNTKSIKKYVSYFEKSKTIFINGTVGLFEDKRYIAGTFNLFNSLKNINAYKIAGGGDTLNAINTFKLDKNFTYLSSGGGASLEYISSDHLEAIDYLENIEKE